MNWVQYNHPGDLRHIKNYCEITRRNTPVLLASVSDSLKSETGSIFAIIQAGDFVEGLCSSYELQVLQFNEAIDFVTPFSASVPFLIAKGNHDITGPGADRAYSDIMLPWLGKQLKTEVSGASYYVKHQGDLFIFFDSYHPDLNWLEEVLSQHPARYVFFIVHQPVVPYNARAQWHIFSQDNERSQRDRLLSLLGKYRAVVLSGHLHHYAILRRETAEGCFVQLAMNSVVAVSEQPVELIEGVKMYTPALVDLEPEFDQETAEKRRALLEEEKPFLSYFELAKTSGYSVVTVSKDAIDIDVHVRSSQSTWRRLRVDRSSLGITKACRPAK
jgi:hypothetical protein